MHIPVFGNGDVDTGEGDGNARRVWIDGKIGREYWLSLGFREVKHFLKRKYLAPPTLEERVEAKDITNGHSLKGEN